MSLKNIKPRIRNPFKPFAEKARLKKTVKSPVSDRYLVGRILMASPGIGDPRFEKSVILVCAHDENGAMGFVINHVLPGINMTQLLEQLDLSQTPLAEKTSNDVPKVTIKPAANPVFSGGPIETARGFVVHDAEFYQDDTIKVGEDFGVTGTIDALKAVASGQGPEKMLFVLGYAGWDPGQLDDELQKNAWLVADPDTTILFETDPDKKWDAALAKLGIDPLMLSTEAGRA